MKYPAVSLRCYNCGGAKYIGEEYVAFEKVWVDVTCIKCAHSVDIETERLTRFLEKLKRAKSANK